MALNDVKESGDLYLVISDTDAPSNYCSHLFYIDRWRKEGRKMGAKQFVLDLR